jgi:hypothetical protein
MGQQDSQCWFSIGAESCAPKARTSAEPSGTTLRYVPPALGPSLGGGGVWGMLPRVLWFNALQRLVPASRFPDSVDIFGWALTLNQRIRWRQGFGRCVSQTAGVKRGNKPQAADSSRTRQNRALATGEMLTAGHLRRGRLGTSALGRQPPIPRSMRDGRKVHGLRGGFDARVETQ